jgi:signal peptidase II
MTENKTEENSTRMSPSRASLKHLLLALPDSKAHLSFWSSMVSGLALDLLTKEAVFDRLKPNETFPVIDGLLQLAPMLNDGAAFGWFSGKSPFLIAVSIIAVVAIFVFFILSKSRQRSVQVGLSLIVACACGNLWDRISNDGYIRDFIDIYYRSYHMHTFNIADSLLCVGVGLSVISILLREN